MSNTFAELVEEVRSRTPDEQEQLLQVLMRARVAAGRDELAAGRQESLELEQRGGLAFSSDARDLLDQLKEP